MHVPVISVVDPFKVSVITTLHKSSCPLFVTVIVSLIVASVQEPFVHVLLTLRTSAGGKLRADEPAAVALTWIEQSASLVMKLSPKSVPPVALLIAILN